MMTDDEKVVKHMEMIQAVINRLAGNSFSVKTWSITIIAALIFFTARSDMPMNFFSWLFIVPVLLFWVLDGYFLWQERAFRGLYDDVRTKDKTDFAMKPSSESLKLINWVRAIISSTLLLFYPMQGLAIFLTQYC